MVSLRKKIFYLVSSIFFFILGFFIVPILPGIQERLVLNQTFSFFSGLTLVFFYLEVVMLREWVTCKKDEIIRKKSIIVFTMVILLVSIFCYPPIMSLIVPLDFYSNNYYYFALFHTFLTSLSGGIVYLLGINSKPTKDQKKDNLVTFLISIITFVSLISIAMSFVLSKSVYSDPLPSFVERLIFFSYFLIIPVVTFCFGNLALLLVLPIVEGVSASLSLIISFFIGTTVLLVIAWNWFALCASTPLVIVIGLFLALYEEKGGIIIKKIPLTSEISYEGVRERRTVESLDQEISHPNSS